VCCSVLHFVASQIEYRERDVLIEEAIGEHEGVLYCVAVCCSVLQRVAVCCSALQCVAVCCSVLQCVAVCCVSD